MNVSKVPKTPFHICNDTDKNSEIAMHLRKHAEATHVT